MVNESEHPRDEEIAAFLDNGLPAVERATVARHLASCADCRRLLDVPHASPGPTRVRRLPWLPVVAVAGAAAAIFAVSLRRPQPPGDVDRIRANATTVETPNLDVRSPLDGANVLVDTLVLRWGSAGAGATYDVSIVDDAGVVLWNARVDSVTIAPPQDVAARLRPGRTYYWRADALLPDLRTASTGPQGFVPTSR